MERKYTLITLLFFIISFCQAQVAIGPTVGLNYSFVEYQNSTLEKLAFSTSFKFHTKSKPAPSLGLKIEIPLNNTLFISINSAYFNSSNEVNACYFLCDTSYFEIEQIIAMSSLNYILAEQFSVGLGLNYLHGRYNHTFDIVEKPKFKDVGLLLSGNYKFKQLVLELLYIQSFKSFGSKISDDTFILKPINNLQLSISYLFKAKLHSGEKNIDCPRF